MAKVYCNRCKFYKYRLTEMIDSGKLSYVYNQCNENNSLKFGNYAGKRLLESRHWCKIINKNNDCKFFKRRLFPKRFKVDEL